MLYEMLTGELPYTGLSIATIVEKVLHEPFPSVRESVPSLPEALEAAILTATARNRDQRFASAREFAEALVPFRGEAVARPPSLRPLDFQTPGAADVDRPGPVAGSATVVVVPTRVYAVATVVAVFAALGVVALLTLFGRGGDDRRGAPPVPPDSVLQAVPGGGDAPAADVVPADIAVDAGGPDIVVVAAETLPYGDADAVAARARVVLRGLPVGAKATLDGKPVDGEFEIEPSDSLRMLEVTGRGWKPYRRELRIVADLVVELQLERRAGAGEPTDAGSVPPPDVAEPPPPPPPPADAGPAASPDAGARDTVGFVPNPFGDA
jgi:hypothetical protein